MLKVNFKNKFFALLLPTFLFIFLFSIPAFSQTGPSAIAQLMVMGKTPEGVKPFIDINGQNSLDGSGLVFPAQISVPADTTATIDFGKNGKIELAPGTIVNLSFSEMGVTANLSEGRLIATCLPQSNFSIKTFDGIIVNDTSRNTVFVTEIVGGATGVNAEAGLVKVNGVPLRAGEVWTADPSKKFSFTANPKTKRDSRKSRFWLVGLGAAVGVGAAITAIAISRH